MFEDFRCDSCGGIHEACVCFNVEEEFYMKEKLRIIEENEKEETYPKFKDGEVEVSEGVIVSKEIYEKFYKDK